jgi:hypothetical protein
MIVDFHTVIRVTYLIVKHKWVPFSERLYPTATSEKLKVLLLYFMVSC